ncbi:hypothetical protein ACHAXN_003472 [Cyclotella atomus]
MLKLTHHVKSALMTVTNLCSIVLTSICCIAINEEQIYNKVEPTFSKRRCDMVLEDRLTGQFTRIVPLTAERTNKPWYDNTRQFILSSFVLNKHRKLNSLTFKFATCFFSSA